MTAAALLADARLGLRKTLRYSIDARSSCRSPTLRATCWCTRRSRACSKRVRSTRTRRTKPCSIGPLRRWDSSLPESSEATDALRLHLRRTPDFGSQRPAKVRVEMLVFDEDRTKTRFVEKEVEVEAGGR